MRTLNLYVTDWAPNGTNDLLICDEENQIVGCVEEATFGIDVMKHRSLINDLIADDTQVDSIERQNEELPSEFTFVRQIDIKTLKRRLCVSPSDPDGADLIRRLKRAGVDIE